MLFAFHALDRPGAAYDRVELYERHKRHLGEAAEHGVELRVTGPLLGEDGVSMIGSLLLFEAADACTARAFVALDPFNAVWGGGSLRAFERRSGGGLS